VIITEELHTSVVMDDLPGADLLSLREADAVLLALESPVPVLLRDHHADHSSAKEMISYA
jgi:hypothetical protein